MEHDLKDIIDQSTIAAIFDVSNTAVSNWTQRYHDFPKPLILLGSSPGYSRTEVKEWYIHRFGQQKFDKVRSNRG